MSDTPVLLGVPFVHPIVQYGIVSVISIRSYPLEESIRYEEVFKTY